jgi:hypothetical protein
MIRARGEWPCRGAATHSLLKGASILPSTWPFLSAHRPPAFRREPEFGPLFQESACIACPSAVFRQAAQPSRNDAAGQLATSGWLLVRATHNPTIKRDIMKSTYLAPLACSALLFECALAYAQTPSSSDPSTMSPHSTQQDTTKSNDVVGSPQPAREDPMATPPSAGQDRQPGTIW